MPVTLETTRQKHWHTLAPKDSLDHLESSEDGLSKQVVEKRKEEFGVNKLPEKKQDSVFVVFLKQFRDPLIYILLVAGAVSLAIQNWSDAIFIIAVLIFNSTLGTIQEYKAQVSAQSLQDVIEKKATVLRAGDKKEIDAEDLVPGDVVLVESGQAVPADIRLLSDNELRADESLLTGESTQANKKTDAELEEDASVGDRKNMLFAGTTITGGRAKGVVVATATHTQVGQIAESLTEESEDPPLVQRMRKLTRLIAIFILGAVIALGIVQIIEGASLSETFMLAVALAVSAIPAGLPVAVTVALSVASHRMAKRNVIVRQLPAVEGLGSCTAICSDKTGTLTQNRLTANRIRMPGGNDYEIQGGGMELEGQIKKAESDEEPNDDEQNLLREAAMAGVFPNEGELNIEDGQPNPHGDTVDIAFLIMGNKINVKRKELLEKHPQVGEIPYSSERKYAASFNQHDDGIYAYVKGAAETIVEMCTIDKADAILEQSDNLAASGYRVIAVASGKVEDKHKAEEGDESILQDLEFKGLIGLMDPVRDNVPESVDRCHSAGVRVRMVTGDHPATASAIGREIKIAGKDEQAMTGKELQQALEENGDKERIQNTHVFARIEPKQKTMLVEHLQDNGEFVAVTGDGVNDAPALNAAHISVAMGQGGTDVARRTAQLILGDDNFASIVNGIEEGRIAYDNVRKVVWLLISTSAAELTLFALALAFGMPLPLFAAQLLWLNLVTNGIQDVALAFEGGEPDILKRKPRKPNERVFNRRMIEQVAITGMYMGIIGFGAFYYMTEYLNIETDQARNLLLLLMVLFENVHIFNCRSEHRSTFKIPLSKNWLLIGTVLAAQSAHIAAMYIPGLKDVLHVQPVSFTAWVTLLGIAITLLAVGELYKLLRRD